MRCTFPRASSGPLLDETAMKVLFVTSQWGSVSPFVEREVHALRLVGIEVDVLTYSGGWGPGAY